MRGSHRPFVTAALSAALAAAGHAQDQATQDPGAWSYVVPDAAPGLTTAPLGAIAMGSNLPDGVDLHVGFRSASPRYGQLRFGSPGSIRVAVALDEVAPGRYELYVDADRSRSLSDGERVAHLPDADNRWRMALDAVIIDGERQTHARREVEFALGGSGSVLGYAVRGHHEGTVEVGGRALRAARVDGDGNGILTDDRDRLLLDLDDDGSWDPLTERFLYAPILTIAGTRYAVRSAPGSAVFSMQELAGTGTVAFRLGPHPTGVEREVLSLMGTLVSEDGITIALRAVDEPATVPAGRYRLTNLQLAFADPAGGPRWNFLFSSDGGPADWKWHEIADGATLTIDPIGTLDFRTGIENRGAMPPGAGTLPLTPRLHTADGLLITTCYRGQNENHGGGTEAAIRLLSADGRELATASSGFA